MNKQKSSTIFMAMLAESDLIVKNLINIFFMGRYLGSEGAAAYEIVMPCIMVVSAVIALCYNGTQAVCSKDYGAGDLQAFERHKNAGYTWNIIAIAFLTMVFTIFKAPVLDYLGANEGSASLAQLSADCYTLFLWCFIPQSFYSMMACLLYLKERKQLLISSAIVYVLMIGGSVIVTVTGPSMTGYMLVNLVCIYVSVIYLIISFIIRHKTSQAAFTRLQIRFCDFKDAFFTGLPDFMEYGLVAILYLVENLYLLSKFSESFVAGVGIFEAIDNIPETFCVGFGFLVTASLGTKLGRYVSSNTKETTQKARDELCLEGKKLAIGAGIGGLILAFILIALAHPLVNIFLQDNEPEAVNCAILLTFSCAAGYVFYLLNTGLVCYYKLVRAFIPAHLMFVAEALLFPLAIKLGLGELFGIEGFCFGGALAEMLVLVLNLFVIWILNKRFPRRFTDIMLDGYLRKLVERRHTDGQKEIL